MAMKKSIGALVATLGLGIVASSEEGSLQPKESKALIPLSAKKREQETIRKAEAAIERKLKRGLKPFEYNGVVIWSRDQKNADRKAKNKGLL